MTSELLRYHADWVLPIVAPPIQDGWVEVVDGRVAALGRGGPPCPAGVEERDLGRVALLPGLVNAHAHLELSWLWGEVPPAGSLPEWVGRLLARRAAAAADDPAAIRQAIIDALEAGTALIADVSNTFASVPILAESPLHAVVFRELLGFNPANPSAVLETARAALAATPVRDHVHLRLAPHAPYSVAPALIQAIAGAARRHGEQTSIHLAESREEIEFLATGAGPWRDLLQQRGAWSWSWTPPACSPVAYLDQLGVLSERLLVVHGVHLADDELGTLAARGCTLVTCPRSNVWVGVGAPPVGRFFASGVRVAVGTDSLASNSDLNLFGELALMHAVAPEVPPARLLESATRNGALGLGLEDFGVIAPGSRARLIAVDLPIDVRDVERYLVEGIEPTQVAWVPPASGPFAPTL